MIAPVGMESSKRQLMACRQLLAMTEHYTYEAVQDLLSLIFLLNALSFAFRLMAIGR